VLIVASLWYLAMTSILYVGQYYVERYFARGSSRALPPTPWQKVRRGVFSFGHDPVALGAPHDGGGGRL
jgi:polar amino acid transport system permease protein